MNNEKPDIMAITETKLCGDIDAFNLGNGIYNIWTINREQEGWRSDAIIEKRMGYRRSKTKEIKRGQGKKSNRNDI